MTNTIEKTGTGSIEHSGTGTIERTGTGSIEHSGTGSIEHSGTGSIERMGTGRIVRGLALAVAMACAFSGAAIAETASYATSHGTIDVHSSGGEVRVSWHYDDGISRQFLVGSAKLNADYSLVKLSPVASRMVKVQTDGTTSTGSSLGSAFTPGGFLKVQTDGTTSTGSSLGGGYAPDHTLKVQTDGSTNTGSALGGGYAPDHTLKVQTDGSTGSSINMELIFTDRGVEAVATRGPESIVLDLNNSAEFSRAVVYVEGTDLF